MTGTQTWQNGNKGLKLGNNSPVAHVLCNTNMMYIPVSRMWNPSFSRLLILLRGWQRRLAQWNLRLVSGAHRKECIISHQISYVLLTQIVLFHALFLLCDRSSSVFKFEQSGRSIFFYFTMKQCVHKKHELVKCFQSKADTLFSFQLHRHSAASVSRRERRRCASAWRRPWTGCRSSTRRSLCCWRTGAVFTFADVFTAEHSASHTVYVTFLLCVLPHCWWLYCK